MSPMKRFLKNKATAMWVRLLCPLLLTLVSSASCAQNAVAIQEVDGKVVKFAFSEKPVVTYSGNTLVVSTAKTMVEYPLYRLKKLYFDTGSQLVNAIEEVKADARFRFSDGCLLISGGQPGSPVQIHTVLGLTVGRYRLDASGNASIPLQGLGSGIYIVKTNMFAFKFRKS